VGSSGQAIVTVTRLTRRRSGSGSIFAVSRAFASLGKTPSGIDWLLAHRRDAGPGWGLATRPLVRFASLSLSQARQRVRRSRQGGHHVGNGGLPIPSEPALRHGHRGGKDFGAGSTQQVSQRTPGVV
jgi:hypothetical protein